MAKQKGPLRTLFHGAHQMPVHGYRPGCRHDAKDASFDVKLRD